MADGVDGGGKRRNTGSQRRSAEARRCPKCNRGAALVDVQPRPTWEMAVTTYCRWDDCDYVRLYPSTCRICRKRTAVVQAGRRLAIISRQTPFPPPFPLCVLCAGDDVEPLGYDPREGRVVGA